MIQQTMLPIIHLIRQTARLCASSAVAASPPQHAAEKALPRIRIAKRAVDKAFYFHIHFPMNCCKFF